ncbi:syntenin related [Holotrichia oblita]|uniref:Syntenin related n=1 Tax=Holotrichia oblita TaxID=644536 RepID=A0ACB9T212_HOLOL|nr:syntenin related [Holotrichia oblita]
MSLYPSLEDMKVDQMAKAQVNAIASAYSSQSQSPPAYSGVPAADIAEDALANNMYPSLGDYMGLELSEAVIAANMPEYSQIAVYQRTEIISPGLYSNMVAPLSSQSLGLKRRKSQMVTLCKDKDNKVGLRVKSIDNGVFVCLVIDKSPAALAGVRFGDQILQINGTNVAGYSMDKVHDLFRKSPVNGIKVALRDRPFERTITLHKDSTNHVGFLFKNGKITSIVKDSSAAKNGLLINHQLLEVDGQNVVGLKDKEITKIIDNCGGIVTITIIPNYVYDHMVKK